MRPTLETTRVLLGRPLSEEECAFLKVWFGESLALEPIRVVASIGHRSWSPFGHRISLIRRHFDDGSARNSVALNNPASAACFAHEALHVWQRQRGRRVTWEGIPLQAAYVVGAKNPYRYQRSRNPEEMLAEFVTGNVEQQGQIFEDYVFARLHGREAKEFAAVANLVRGV